jgi:hypothetical protein
MERYRIIRKCESSKYIIYFQCSDNKKYYIANGYKFVLIEDNINVEELDASAKRYSLQGAKVVCAKLWKELGYINEEQNGFRIVKSGYFIDKYLKDSVKLRYYIN